MSLSSSAAKEFLKAGFASWVSSSQRETGCKALGILGAPLPGVCGLGEVL